MIQSEVRILVVNDERNIGNNLSMVLDWPRIKWTRAPLWLASTRCRYIGEIFRLNRAEIKNRLGVQDVIGQPLISFTGCAHDREL
jgi:hypothetical protein